MSNTAFIIIAIVLPWLAIVLACASALANPNRRHR